METIERKVHFFRIQAFGGFGIHRKEIDFLPILKYADLIDWREGTQPGRYLADARDKLKEVALDKIEVTKDRVLGTIASIKRGDRPSVEQRFTGKFEPLKNLREDDGLVEMTHFVFYPEDKILAMEFNHRGARASSLVNYLSVKAGTSLVSEIEAVPVSSDDFQKSLSKIKDGGIKIADVAVFADKNELIKDAAPGIYKAVKALAENGPEIVHVVLGPRPFSKKRLSFMEELERIGKSLLRHKVDHPDEAFKTFKITAEANDGTGERVFDLLEEKFLSTVHVVKEDANRSVDSNDMYQKIDLAYQIKKTEILKAVGGNKKP